MEELGDILKRMAVRDTSENNPYASRPSPTDHVDIHEPCGGRGWFTTDVPVGDPDFGRVITCDCQSQVVENERFDKLLRYSNLQHLARFTFESITTEGLIDDLANTNLFSKAYKEAVRYSEDPKGWLVFCGPHGSGKTHLAAAIGNQCIRKGRVVFFTHVPDLMDHLRSAFSPTSDVAYSELFDQVKSTPLLILDGLASQSVTPWAEEKLHQILNHRINAELPTVITLSGAPEELDPYLASRLNDSKVSKVIQFQGPEHSRNLAIGQVPQRLLDQMTFDTFDTRGNNPNRSQQSSLEFAYKFAKRYADDPDGWITIFGGTGVGKTHLAIAIAAHRMKEQHAVTFVLVADLLDHLRSAYGMNSSVSYDERFDEIKDAPLLILDDLGKQRSSSWADEKLHQLIVHRHNLRLPTVITTMVDATRPEGPISSRIQDPSVGELIYLDAPDYRNKGRIPSQSKKTRSK